MRNEILPFHKPSITEEEIEEGVQLQWIGCDHCGEVCGIDDGLDCLWYIDTVPELSSGDEFESQTECIEITNCAFSSAIGQVFMSKQTGNLAFFRS